MSKQYDVIVVGAGNGGLAAAATTAKNGLKTLVLERHNLPGGAATSFRRGRFEFEPSLHELARVGTEENPGDVRNLFKALGADVDWYVDDHTFHLMVPSEGIDADMPSGVPQFVAEMERQVPGCQVSVMKLFELAMKAKNALGYLSSGTPDPKVLASEHADFLRMIGYTVNEGFEAIGMPKRAQDILSTYWCYMGAPGDQMDFFMNALLLLSYVGQGAGMPALRSHELSLSLEKSIRDNGGEVWYNSEVTKFLVKDGAVYGVVVDGQEIYADHVIANCFPNFAFSEKMMDKEDIPEAGVRVTNARDFGLSFVTVYLGMNKTAEELGIPSYSNFVAPCGDSIAQRDACTTRENSGYVIMNCLNKVVPNASPEGTCTLFFTTMYYGNCWDDVTPAEYRKLKNKIAGEMIETVEKAMGLDLKPYIEEISVAGPPTFARYLGAPQGTPYGYQIKKDDSMMIRMMAKSDAPVLKGLRFCGAFGERTDGYSSAYLNGFDVGNLTVQDVKEGK